MKTVPREYRGFYWPDNTPLELADIIANAYERKERLRVYYCGDDGVSWLEEHDIKGCIGRSTGPLKIPLLVARKNSMGGGALLTGCIGRVDCIESRRILYKRDNFAFPPLAVEQLEKADDTGNCWAVTRADTNVTVATFDRYVKALKYVDFITGVIHHKGGHTHYKEFQCAHKLITNNRCHDCSEFIDE